MGSLHSLPSRRARNSPAALDFLARLVLQAMPYEPVLCAAVLQQAFCCACYEMPSVLQAASFESAVWETVVTTRGGTRSVLAAHVMWALARQTGARPPRGRGAAAARMQAESISLQTTGDERNVGKWHLERRKSSVERRRRRRRATRVRRPRPRLCGIIDAGPGGGAPRGARRSAART